MLMTYVQYNPVINVRVLQVYGHKALPEIDGSQTQASTQTRPARVGYTVLFFFIG